MVFINPDQSYNIIALSVTCDGGTVKREWDKIRGSIWSTHPEEDIISEVAYLHK